MKNLIFKHIIHIFRLMWMLPLLWACSGGPDNLVHNPGFESGEGEEPAGWVKMARGENLNYFAAVDTEEFHSGKASYKISRIWSWDAQPGISLADPVSIDPQNDYILSFWYKTDIEEYPLALDVTFNVHCENTPRVRYMKYVPNSKTWKQYFILLDNIPADALKAGIGFSSGLHTQGSIWLDDIVFKTASREDLAFFESWRRQPVPPVAGHAGNNTFAGNGFYRVEKGKDRWWYVDPEGNPVWLTGTDGRCPVPGNDDFSEFLVAPSDLQGFHNTYGKTTEEIITSFYKLFMLDCGFNAFSGGTWDIFAPVTEALYKMDQDCLPMTKQLRLTMVSDDPALLATDRNGNRLDKGIHLVVDPWNPVWRQLARQAAEEMIPAYRDKPWFTGWFVSNEMDYNDLYRYFWAEYSSLEFIKVLTEKYVTIEKLNETWTSPFGSYNFSSFEDILAVKPEPKDWNDPLWVDFLSFERRMIGEYINFTYDLVKELDPHHPVISNRNNLDPMPHMYRHMDLWGKYDIVCMNIYPDNNKIGFNEGELEMMRMLHRNTGKPMLIGEWSVPAIDSGLYEFGEDPHNRRLDWSFPQVLRTQAERGEAYEMCIKQLASLDFMVGAHWFRTHDVDTDIRRANRGLMNGSYQLYSELTGAMKKAHDDIKRDMGLRNSAENDALAKSLDQIKDEITLKW